MYSTDRLANAKCSINLGTDRYLVPLPKFRYPDGDSLMPDSLAVLLACAWSNVVINSTHETFLCFGSSHTSTSLRTLTPTGLGSCPKSRKFIYSHLDTSPLPILCKFSAEFRCQFRTQFILPFQCIQYESDRNFETPVCGGSLLTVGEKWGPQHTWMWGANVRAVM